MGEYKTWRVRGRNTRTGDIDFIIVGGCGLQTNDDVARHVAGWAHLQFLDCAPWHFAPLRDTEKRVLSARPINPELFMAGTMADMRRDIEKYLVSVGRWSGKTTRTSDLLRAAAEVSKAEPKPHAETPAAPPPPGQFRSRFVRLIQH